MYESPSLFIDFSRLPPPSVIETISYENLLQAYKDRVVKAKPELEAATKLEQSAINVILQTEAYGEMLVRQRINAAARAVMLPFATGSDLDVLASLYNIARQPIVDEPRLFTTHPQDWESDDRFRSRVQGAPEAFSMAGTAGSYRFHAMSAISTLRDASAMRIDNAGGIKVTLMADGPVPDVSLEDRMKVKIKLEEKNIKPLTDTISVASVTRKDTPIVARVTLYPGPDASFVKTDIENALQKLRGRISLLGRDLTRAAIITALNQEGVMNVELASPAQDVVCNMDECAWITTVSVTFNSERGE